MEKTKNTKKKAFTLVELIIVVTIFTILTTIGFIGFSGYTKKSRDSVREVALTDLSKALEVHRATSGSYPKPENITHTGTLLWTQVVQVWKMWENLSKILWFSKPLFDPTTKSSYVYGVTTSQKNYQITATLEGNSAFSFVTQTYAKSPYTARVKGNYNGLLTFMTWGQKFVSNVPSLIFTGSGDLFSTGTYFVVDDGKNIAYSLEAKTFENTEVSESLLPTALTWVAIPSKQSEFLINAEVFESILWVDRTTIEYMVYGTNWQFVMKNETTPEEEVPEIPEIPQWKCWDILTLSWSDITYTTKYMPDGRCWTTQNMRHEVNNCRSKNHDWTLPHDSCETPVTNTWYSIESHGLLYQWEPANQVCQALWTWWSLPTDTQWHNIDLAYHDTITSCDPNRSWYGCSGGWWFWTKWWWLISNLPWMLNPARTHDRFGIRWDRWASTMYNSTNAYRRSLFLGSDSLVSWTYSTIRRTYTQLWDAQSVVCTKTLPPEEIPPISWKCWDQLTVDGYKYNTKKMNDGTCWTATPMKHWDVMLVWTWSDSFPSDATKIEKWCYDSNPANCQSHGALYSWYEALWIWSGSTLITEDTSKSVCWKLWTWWGLPSDNDFITLKNSPNNCTWWYATSSPYNLSNNMCWLSPIRGWDLKATSPRSFVYKDQYQNWWSSGQANSVNGLYTMIQSNQVNPTTTRSQSKLWGFSIICVNKSTQ